MPDPTRQTITHRVHEKAVDRTQNMDAENTTYGPWPAAAASGAPPDCTLLSKSGRGWVPTEAVV